MALQVVRGTTIAVSDAAGDDYHITLRTLADGAGRQSAQIDLTATDGTRYYEITAEFAWAATPTVGEAVKVYWKESVDNATAGTFTNDDGTGDIVVSAEDKLKNLLFLGIVACDQAAANIPTARNFGVVEITQRYGNIVVWNDGGAAINNVNDTDNVIRITPITYQDV